MPWVCEKCESEFDGIKYNYQPLQRYLICDECELIYDVMELISEKEARVEG